MIRLTTDTCKVENDVSWKSPMTNAEDYLKINQISLRVHESKSLLGFHRTDC